MIDLQWRDAHRILLIRLDNLGDVLVTTPAFRAVRHSLPDAEIALLTSPVGAQAGRLDPDLDHVITYEAPWVDPWAQLPFDPHREQEMIATLRERAFDGAIIFTSFRQSALPAAYLCYLAGIPLRLAASTDASGSLLTTRHKHPDRMMHEVERGLDLVGAIGISTDRDDLVLSVPIAANAVVERVVDDEPRRDGEPLVVIHPGSSKPARTYPWEMYAEVADLLLDATGAKIVLTGSGDEATLVERIRSRMRHGASALNAAGHLDFPELCGLIDQADLTITNNTGPMHVAAAVKTPVIALFALTNPPEQWGPWRVPHRQLYADVPCRLCYQRICPYGHECLRLVSPETVVDVAREMLAAEAARAVAGWEAAS